MNKFLLVLLLLIALAMPASAERPADVKPVYIGALLIDEPDLDDMANLCRYYGFTEQTPSDNTLSDNTGQELAAQHTYYTRANTLRPSRRVQNPTQEAALRSSGERIFSRSDGAEIHFRVTGLKENRTPVVEIRTSTPLEQLKKELKSIRFKPSKQAPNQYYKGTTLANRHSVATLSGDKTSGTVTFTKLTLR